MLKRAHGGVEPLLKVASEATSRGTGFESVRPDTARAGLEAIEKNRELPPRILWAGGADRGRDSPSLRNP